jgi:hypothetical protein
LQGIKLISNFAEENNGMSMAHVFNTFELQFIKQYGGVANPLEAML